MKWDPIALCLVLLVAASIFFLFFPGIDIAVTRFFYVPGVGFPRADIWLFQTLRMLSDVLMWAIVLISLCALAFHFTKLEWKKFLTVNQALFLLSTLVVGPGLIVNLVLKNQWGRPRPLNVENFGGDYPYVEVWRISEYCATNCSFVSGEASSAIWLVTLALIAPQPWRLKLGLPILVFASLLSINRIAVGAHFLSDVVISWLLTLLVIAVFHRLLIARRV